MCLAGKSSKHYGFELGTLTDLDMITPKVVASVESSQDPALLKVNNLKQI